MHWSLNSESGRVAMEGKKISLALSYATESVIILHQSVPAFKFQSVRTWSKLQSCSFVPSKILKTDSNSWSTRTEPESLKTTFHVLQDHGWFLGSVLCRTITFSLVKQHIKPSVITGKSSKWLWTTWWRPQRCRHQVWVPVKRSVLRNKKTCAHASLGYKLKY